MQQITNVEARVIYQRPAPQGDPPRNLAAKKLWAVYEYGCFVFDEFFRHGGSRRKQTAADAYAVMNGYRDGMNERVAESKATFVADALEMEHRGLTVSKV